MMGLRLEEGASEGDLAAAGDDRAVGWAGDGYLWLEVVGHGEGEVSGGTETPGGGGNT